ETMGTPEFTNAASLSVYEVDTATDTVTAPDAPTVIDFETTPYEDHGYGYTQPILDTEHGKLYALACGGEAPGYMAWFIYDLETRTWDPECHTFELFARYCYINGYPDGNGGFTIVVERDAPITALKEALGVNFSTTGGYAFDAISVMHVADPAVDELEEIPVCFPEYTAEGYNNTGKNRMDSASHYGVGGCTYLDSSDLLHIIYTHKCGNTSVVSVMHAIYDLEGNEIYKKLIPTSLLPKNGTKTYKGANGFAMTQGADGKYYIFVLTNATVATLEIWSSPADDGKTFKKIVGPLTLTDAEGNTVSSALVPIIANTRNRSLIDGVADIMFHSTATVNGGDPYYFVSVRLNEPEHVHDYVAVVTEPTCTEQGYTTYTCSGCGDSYVDDYTDALGHDWGEWIVTTDPTCTEAGEQTRVCARCGETETQSVDALGHDYVAVVTEPSCTEQGFTTYTCSGCGDIYVDEYTDALGHDWGEWTVTTDPTCTEAGEQTRVCARCGETETQSVDALGHDWDTVVTAPSCEAQGYTTYTCARCGETYVDEYTDALGHDWDDGAVTVPATEKEDGIMTYTCRRCAETRNEVIPKTGRDLIDSTKIFKDVKPGKWYTEAVDYVYTYELMNGMTDDTFAPNADMSRAMLVTVLWRAEGSPAPKGSAPFTDLKAGWYKDAVAWAYENKIVNGITETSFAPDSSVTREQIAAIFYRFAGFKGRDVSGAADITKFPDGSKVSKYARPAMSWAVADGLISGTKIGGADYLDPKGNATRAQVATILMRYLSGGRS
ncbi:MAG: S-layer homology domain-containing protein, partial [Clostridia bacterium]|nr:S-layer homology domain-containing protein [Clostridia bacterium]